MAPAAAPEPARPRRGSRDLLQTFELSGDGPLPTQSRDVAEAFRSARSAVARAKYVAHLRGVRTHVLRTQVGRSVVAGRAGSDGNRAQGSRALPGHRSRP